MRGVRVFNISMDGVSAAAIAGALMQWLPPMAALGAVLWYAMQIYESKTVQRHIRLHRARARAKRRAAREP